eukprot:m.256506 g.256506  ORF g.256506 m.256506 type:complete len:2258 (-) comp19172_c2_seq6:43-6816(-)
MFEHFSGQQYKRNTLQRGVVGQEESIFHSLGRLSWSARATTMAVCAGAPAALLFAAATLVLMASAVQLSLPKNVDQEYEESTFRWVGGTFSFSDDRNWDLHAPAEERLVVKTVFGRSEGSVAVLEPGKKQYLGPRLEFVSSGNQRVTFSAGSKLQFRTLDPEDQATEQVHWQQDDDLYELGCHQNWEKDYDGKFEPSAVRSPCSIDQATYPEPMGTCENGLGLERGCFFGSTDDEVEGAEGSDELCGMTTCDVDECASGSTNMCHTDAVCVNLPGTYSCKCNDGFEDPVGTGIYCRPIADVPCDPDAGDFFGLGEPAEAFQEFACQLVPSKGRFEAATSSVAMGAALQSYLDVVVTASDAAGTPEAALAPVLLDMADTLLASHSAALTAGTLAHADALTSLETAAGAVSMALAVDTDGSSLSTATLDALLHASARALGPASPAVTLRAPHLTLHTVLADAASDTAVTVAASVSDKGTSAVTVTFPAPSETAGLGTGLKAYHVVVYDKAAHGDASSSSSSSSSFYVPVVDSASPAATATRPLVVRVAVSDVADGSPVTTVDTSQGDARIRVNVPTPPQIPVVGRECVSASTAAVAGQRVNDDGDDDTAGSVTSCLLTGVAEVLVRVDPALDAVCQTNFQRCSEHAECRATDDTVSGWTCTCRDGFAGRGYRVFSGAEVVEDQCTDVDECRDHPGDGTVGNGVCDPHATCTNTEGGFECACPAAGGFVDAVTDPSDPARGHTCNDVDECADNTHGCSPGTEVCFNTPGSFACWSAVGPTEFPLSATSPSAVRDWILFRLSTVGASSDPAAETDVLVAQLTAAAASLTAAGDAVQADLATAAVEGFAQALRADPTAQGSLDGVSAALGNVFVNGMGTGASHADVYAQNIAFAKSLRVAGHGVPAGTVLLASTKHLVAAAEAVVEEEDQGGLLSSFVMQAIVSQAETAALIHDASDSLSEDLQQLHRQQLLKLNESITSLTEASVKAHLDCCSEDTDGSQALAASLLRAYGVLKGKGLGAYDVLSEHVSLLTSSALQALDEADAAGVLGELATDGSAARGLMSAAADVADARYARLRGEAAAAKAQREADALAEPCGNGVCNAASEDCSTCPGDCGACSAPTDTLVAPPDGGDVVQDGAATVHLSTVGAPPPAVTLATSADWADFVDAKSPGVQAASLVSLGGYTAGTMRVDVSRMRLANAGVAGRTFALRRWESKGRYWTASLCPGASPAQQFYDDADPGTTNAVGGKTLSVTGCMGGDVAVFAVDPPRDVQFESTLLGVIGLGLASAQADQRAKEKAAEAAAAEAAAANATNATTEAPTTEASGAAATEPASALNGNADLGDALTTAFGTVNSLHGALGFQDGESQVETADGSLSVKVATFSNPRRLRNRRMRVRTERGAPAADLGRALDNVGNGRVSLGLAQVPVGHKAAGAPMLDLTLKDDLGDTVGIQDLSEPLRLQFGRDPAVPAYQYRCVFLNVSTEQFDTSGVTREGNDDPDDDDDDDDVVTCASNHATAFTVEIDFTLEAPSVSLANFDPTKTPYLYLVTCVIYSFILLVAWYSHIERKRWLARQAQIEAGVIKEDPPEELQRELEGPEPSNDRNFVVRFFVYLRHALVTKHVWLASVWPSAAKIYPRRFLTAYGLVASVSMNMGLNAVFAYAASQNPDRDVNMMRISGHKIPLDGIYSFLIMFPALLVLSVILGLFSAYMDVLQKYAPKRFRQIMIDTHVVNRGEKKSRRKLKKQQKKNKRVKSIRGSDGSGWSAGNVLAPANRPLYGQASLASGLSALPGPSMSHVTQFDNPAYLSVADDGQGRDGATGDGGYLALGSDMASPDALYGETGVESGGAGGLGHLGEEDRTAIYESFFVPDEPINADYLELGMHSQRWSTFDQYEGSGNVHVDVDGAPQPGVGLGAMPQFLDGEVDEGIYGFAAAPSSAAYDMGASAASKAYDEPVYDFANPQSIAEAQRRRSEAPPEYSVLENADMRQAIVAIFTRSLMDLDQYITALSARGLLDAQVPDRDGPPSTLLTKVVRDDWLEGASALLNAGADPTVVNHNGMTAIHESRSKQMSMLLDGSNCQAGTAEYMAANDDGEDDDCPFTEEQIDEFTTRMLKWRRLSNWAAGLCTLAGVLLTFLWVGSFTKDDQIRWIKAFGEYIIMSAFIAAPLMVFLLSLRKAAKKKKEIEQIKRQEERLRELQLSDSTGIGFPDTVAIESTAIDKTAADKQVGTAASKAGKGDTKDALAEDIMASVQSNLLNMQFF